MDGEEQSVPLTVDAKAKLLRVSGSADDVELARRWIIQVGGSYYLLGPKGYGPARKKEEAAKYTLRDALGRNPSVRLSGYNAQGVIVHRTVENLLEAYATVADGGIVSNMTIEDASLRRLSDKLSTK